MKKINKIKIAFFSILIVMALLGPAKKTVFAVTLEDIRAEIKCPDHDRPEIVSLVEGLIKEGKSREEILDTVAEKFGSGVLVNPVEEKSAVPFVIPTVIIGVAFILVFGFIKKWINKGEKTTEQEKEIVNAAKGLSDYEKRFNEEYERFKKEE